MNNLQEMVSKELEEIRQMEEFISLYFRKVEMMPQLKAISKKMVDLKPLVEDCSEILEKYYDHITIEYRKLIDKMKLQQLTILNIITALNKKKGLQTKDNIFPNEQFCESTPTTKNLNPSYSPGKSRMFLSDYKQSPFVSRLRPVSLQFLDFEARLTKEMFDSIPRYMRGRETIDELISFLEQIIVPCFTEKYQIIYKKRSCLRNPTELELWKLYREQASSFPGHKFITQGDISRKINRLIDKKMSSKIAMLRHLGILKEERKQSTVFYLWIDRKS